MTPLRLDAHVRGLAGIACLIFVLANLVAVAQTSVTTYHNDNFRTGWNSNETILTPANVNATQFGVLASVAVDDQVDAQPLLVPGVNIMAGSHKGTHDVVYVVTGNDTVYAIDANVGGVLLSQHLGSPVPKPLGCGNNGPNVGITSTPVIDTSSSTLYLMAYTQDSTGPAYRLHAMDLGSLTNKGTPQLVSASHTLSDGTTQRWNHLHFQCDLLAATSGPAVGERKHLCRVWQLLRFRREHFARMVAGLECSVAGAAFRQSDS